MKGTFIAVLDGHTYLIAQYSSGAQWNQMGLKDLIG